MRTIHGHAMPEPVLDGNGKVLTGTPMCAGHKAQSNMLGGFSMTHHRVTVCGRCVADDAMISLGSLSCAKCRVILNGPASQGVRW